MLVRLDTRTKTSRDYLLAFGASIIVGAALAKLGSSQHQTKGILLGIAAVGIVIVASYPILAFPFLLLFAPFEFPVKFLGNSVGTNEVVAIGVALVLLPRLRLRQVPRWALIGFGMLVAGSLLSCLAADNQAEALWGAMRWLTVAIIALAAFQMLREHILAFRQCAAIISATAIVVALFAFLQREHIYWIVGPPYLSGRVDSSFGYYTNYGGYMMIAFLVALGASIDAARERKVKALLLHWTALLCTGAGIGLSLSRGAIFGVAVGVAAMLALNLKKPARFFTLAVTAVACGILVWQIIPPSTRASLAERFSQSNTLTEGSNREHYTLAHIGEQALTRHALGIGYGNFPSYLEKSGALTQLDQTFFHAHRMPVQVGLDAGWIGLGGFVILTIAPLFVAISAARRRQLTFTVVGLTGALVAFLAQGWFDYLFDELSFLIIYSALVWAIWSAVRTDAEHGAYSYNLA